MPSLISFFSYTIVTSFTPGPNNIMSMLNAGKNGMKKALRFSIGVSLGFVVLLTLSMIFGSFLLQYLPQIKPYLTYIGAAYILYLAYKTIKSDYKTSEQTDSLVYGVKEGFLLQFVNPKAIIYSITITATFILPYYDNVFVLVFFVVCLGAVAIAATLSWAAFGSAFNRLFTKYTKVINVVMASVLVFTAVSLFF